MCVCASMSARRQPPTDCMRIRSTKNKTFSRCTQQSMDVMRKCPQRFVYVKKFKINLIKFIAVNFVFYPDMTANRKRPNIQKLNDKK